MAEKEIRSILATDCGSTTTKAILIEKQGDEYYYEVIGDECNTLGSKLYDCIAAASAYYGD